MTEERFIGLAALLVLAVVLGAGIRALQGASRRPTRLIQAVAIGALATGWLQILSWLSGPGMTNLGFLMLLVFGIGVLLSLPVPLRDRPQTLANVAATDLLLSIYWAIWVARVDHDVTNEVGATIGVSLAQIVVVLTLGAVLLVRGFITLVERRNASPL